MVGLAHLGLGSRTIFILTIVALAFLQGRRRAGERSVPASRSAGHRDIACRRQRATVRAAAARTTPPSWSGPVAPRSRIDARGGACAGCGERYGTPSGFSPASIVISKTPVAVQLPQPDVSANRDAPQTGSPREEPEFRAIAVISLRLRDRLYDPALSRTSREARRPVSGPRNLRAPDRKSKSRSLLPLELSSPRKQRAIRHNSYGGGICVYLVPRGITTGPFLARLLVVLENAAATAGAQLVQICIRGDRHSIRMLIHDCPAAFARASVALPNFAILPQLESFSPDTSATGDVSWPACCHPGQGLVVHDFTYEIMEDNEVFVHAIEGVASCHRDVIGTLID